MSEKETKEKTVPEGHFVYVGKKGVMAYVLAVITQFSDGAKEISIKARGKSISRAIDVLEIVKNKDMGIKVKAINTKTEDVETDDGRPLKVSAIEIKITQ
jgi:archaea-specific DNA-binding protein